MKLKYWLAGSAVVPAMWLGACSKARDFSAADGAVAGSAAGEDATGSGGTDTSASNGGAPGSSGGDSSAEAGGGGADVGGAPTSTECADGTFDCNESASDGCETTEPPALETPVILGPLRGAYTGSVHAPAQAASLRPVVRYSADSPGCGTVHYEVQFDDSCEPGKLEACEFDSVEHEGSSKSGTYQPEQALPVSMVAPVGALYAWRVRACDASQRCSDWSTPTHLNVGRTLQDINGDGYADVIASSEAGTEVYFGSASFNGKADARLPKGTYPRFIGDVNADGFGDVAAMIGGYEPCTGSGMVVNVMYGAASLVKPKTQTLCRTAGSPSVMTTVTDAGDLNGDGFDDLAVAWGFGSLENSLLVFPGGVEVSNEPLAEAQIATTDISYALTVTSSQVMSGRGNYDGDTFPDLVAAGWGTDKSAARLYVWKGAPKLASAFSETIADPACYSVRWLDNAGDSNADGLDDWALVCSGVDANSRRFAVLQGGTPSKGAVTKVWTTSLALQSTTPFFDFDGDSNNEFLLGISDDTAVIWQPGVSDATAPGHYARYSGATFVDTADHNGDGRLDVAFGSNKGASRVGSSTSFNVVPTPLTVPSDATSVTLAF